MTPRMVCGIPRLIAAFKSSELAPFNAWAPPLTNCCQSSQSTGTDASVAEVEKPETVPGARFGLTVDDVLGGDVAEVAADDSCPSSGILGGGLPAE